MFCTQKGNFGVKITHFVYFAFANALLFFISQQREELVEEIPAALAVW